ncbi:MarC family protein [Aquabacter sp. CN5-332]|uniref:MarC family protein n=1 Tax=Aquabacter sp. CN5-332 TaxID=3156608 RepID=UPI0032B38135
MLEDLNLLVTQFVTLWAVLEPISHLSLFLATTSDMTPKQRHKVAVLCCAFAFLILTFFIIAGRALLDAMGISVLSFQIAGGLVLFMYATSMIFSEPHTPPALEVSSDKHVASLAVYPLAIPIIAGPGAILSVVILSDNNRHVLSHQAVTIAVVAMLMLILMVLFWLGDYVIKVIGTSGANLIRRIMGLVLAALSVDIVLTALSRWLSLPPI